MSEPAPLFSIVTPVYNTPLDVLEQMVESVLGQTFRDWELILVDDCSKDERVRDLSACQARPTDPRIRLIERTENGHIVVASNDGVDAARGEFIALLDHDDLLVAAERSSTWPRPSRTSPRSTTSTPTRTRSTRTGDIFDDFRKPAWSPEQLRGHMYTCHFSVLRASLVREVGGFHEGFEGSQDHDLVLRVTEQARKVVHIPKILYHWRVIPGSAAGDPHAKPYAWVAGVKAVQAHLDRMGIDATVDFGPGHSTYRIERKLDPAVRVSVVIPTAGADGLVWGERRYYVVEAVRSLARARRPRQPRDRRGPRRRHPVAGRSTSCGAWPAPAPSGPLRQALRLQREVQPRRPGAPRARSSCCSTTTSRSSPTTSSSSSSPRSSRTASA